MSGAVKFLLPSGGSTTLTGTDTAVNSTVSVPSVDGAIVLAFKQASVQTANFTAAAWNSYPVNTTTGPVTVTLPASPTPGQQINVFDYAGTAASNNITVNPNGGKINGSVVNAIVSTSRASITLVYVDSTQGWVDIAIGNTNYLSQPYSSSYLVVAGGGGGIAGGGGAGGVLQSASFTLYTQTVYTITVGAGGSSSNGSNSVISSSLGTVTSIGGGTGGGYSSTNGTSGGSGGGGGGGSTTSAGSGTAGQGSAGGSGATSSGGGGGGAGGTGSASSGGVGGTGGTGISSSITGASVNYAGGGGGGGNSSGGSASYGGGAGNTASGTAGTVNTGGGSGGGYAGQGANGGSGVVILSVPTANYSGVTTGSPTVTTSGSNTIIKFTSSGSYTA